MSAKFSWSLWGIAKLRWLSNLAGPHALYYFGLHLFIIAGHLEYFPMHRWIYRIYTHTEGTWASLEKYLSSLSQLLGWAFGFSNTISGLTKQVRNPILKYSQDLHCISEVSLSFGSPRHTVGSCFVDGGGSKILHRPFVGLPRVKFDAHQIWKPKKT